MIALDCILPNETVVASDMAMITSATVIKNQATDRMKLCRTSSRRSGCHILSTIACVATFFVCGGICQTQTANTSTQANVSEIRHAAEQNDPKAQTNLGVRYEKGDGLPQDYAQAASWYRKAADQGDSFAQDHLGWLYGHGLGVPQDYTQAAFWHRKAAEQGFASAQYSLGVLYWLGEGVNKDYVQAVGWFSKAAEQGNTDAQRILVKVYKNGVDSGNEGRSKIKGIRKDEAQAAYWEDRLLAQEEKDFEHFRQQAAAWRASSPKPPLNSLADKEWILAENATRERNLNSAIRHYENAVSVQPMWPTGWFNLAMIYGEQSKYAEAADRMKHYLELAPDASDAKGAREQMIIWEDKAKNETPHQGPSSPTHQQEKRP